MSDSDAIDGGYLERAKRRAETAWVRVVDRVRAGEDDPDDLVMTAAERVALVDTLMLAACRAGGDRGTEPRLQRSVVRVFKRGR